MEREALKALLLPFDKGERERPTLEQPWLFINALPVNDPAWRDALRCQQGFRPTYLALHKAGYAVSPTVDDRHLAGAMVLTARDRTVNQKQIANALLAVDEGAPIMVAGEKTSGIQPLKRWASELADVVDSFSKFHAQCFTMIATDSARKAVASMVNDQQAGLFAKGETDRGSALLIGTFDQTIKGDVADFGAGAGVLSKALLERADPASIDMIEADHAPYTHLTRKIVPRDGRLSAHWLDVAGETMPGRYDWVIMNPPFHTGRAAEPKLGQDFIRAAKKALKPKGRLRLVANRQLPYERTLEEVFGSFREVAARDGFKVLEAQAR